MSENKLYEISNLIKNPDNLKEDILDAFNIISEHLKNKYIAPIEQEIKICSDKCKESPPNTVTLLEACRPFVKDNNQIDKCINILNNINVIDKLVNTQEMTQNDSSIHSDGIYDIDYNCKKNNINTENIVDQNPIIFILILFLIK